MNLTADPLADAPPADTPGPGAAAADPAAALPLTVIEARPAWAGAGLVELWRARELLFFLTLRDIKLRYKQTVLGFAWAFLQPLATAAVFVVFLGWMGGTAKGVEDYPLFVLAGVLPWTLFANGATTAANSLVANERLVTKTYFPRLLLPLSAVGAALFDFLVGVLLLIGLAAWYGVPPTPALLLVPVVVGLIALAAAGVGILGSALVAAQRDFKHLIQFGMPLWMFATPCIFLPPERYPFGPAARDWLAVNPAYGLVQNFRAAALGQELDVRALVISAAVGAVLLAAGVLYFHRVERTLADSI